MTAATGNPATVIGDWTFVTKDADGQDLTINIDNAYQDYQSNPENLATIIARFASVFGRGVEAATADQLVLIVRPLSYVEQTIPTGGATDKFPAAHPIAGDLAYFLAIDAPESIRIATLDDLKGWNLDEASAWKRAQSNLKARIGPIGFAGLEHEPAARLIVADSGLAPSILSDPALCGPASPSGLLAFVIARFSARGLPRRQGLDPRVLEGRQTFPRCRSRLVFHCNHLRRWAMDDCFQPRLIEASR